MTILVLSIAGFIVSLYGLIVSIYNMDYAYMFLATLFIISFSIAFMRELKRSETKPLESKNDKEKTK
jgi:hypothetical protein